MSKLFLGKFQAGDQLEQNLYHLDAMDEAKMNRYLNGMEIGDYVLAKRKSVIEKLVIYKGIVKRGEKHADATFEDVKVFRPPLSLVGDLVCCKFVKPDINLLNKAIKSTSGYGFIPIELEQGSPDIEEIDFIKSKRRYFICLKSMLEHQSLFKPSDICLVLDDVDNGKIIDAVEFSGKEFSRKESLWKLYEEKTAEEQFTLPELLDYASDKNDKARNKRNYLTAILEAVGKDGYFPADSPVAMYDNVIVGRRRKKPKNADSVQSDPVDSGDDDIGDEQNEEDVSDDPKHVEYAQLLNFNPNIILYGPPGTGKTYGAQKIVEAFERTEGRQMSFEQIRKEGRVDFTTFHQAYSYEDFVEGIRPVLDEGDAELDDNDGASRVDGIKYKLVDGLFKRIAKKCETSNRKKASNLDLPDTSESSRVWKVSLGTKNETTLYTSLCKQNIVAVGYDIRENLAELDEKRISELKIPPALNALYARMSIGDLVLIFNDPRTVRRLGVVTGEYEYSKNDENGYRHRRRVQWLGDFENSPKDIYNLNQKKKMVQSAIYELNVLIPDALSLLDPSESTASTASIALPYYLIIDEINRGNIAKIFGELITLIEKDKRETLSCTLPYSRKDFIIPENLYIIGTMNTSDRSIALLDTALRRRFAFIEICPYIEIVKEKHPTVGGNVSPADLLKELNVRITETIDRDHRIGHSYFLGDDLTSRETLFNVWYYKVLPLLMEYFYNDTKKVIEIIGKRFFDSQTEEIVPLSLKPNETGVSEFEAALMAIYEKGEK